MKSKKSICLFSLWLLVPLLASNAIASGQEPQLSPAERKIAAARRAVAEHPEKYQFYNDLALALIRRVRETSEFNYYDQAEDALKQSLRLAPDNFESQKLHILLILGREQYAQARDAARALNKRMPDDVMVWGYIADADLALGDYDDAEKRTQWMLDLRPGNTPGFERAARLRTFYGDFDGAMDFLRQAYLATPPSDSEDLAWYTSQMGDLDLMAGKVEDAGKFFTQALQLFPRYYLGLEGMARVRMAQHRSAEAVELLRQRNQVACHPQDLLALGKALEAAGRRDEADRAYREFEAGVRGLIAKPGNADRELVLYYVDRAHRPDEALRIAQIEVARRHDVATLDAYGWALYANGNFAEARRQLEKALSVGVRDATLFFHVGCVASKLDDRTAAARYFKQSLDLNPFSDVAAAAREALDRRAPASATLR